VLSFAASAALLVPRLGVIGYGWAALISVIAYVVVHVAVVRHVGRLDYRLPFAWAGAFAVAVFAPWVGVWALFGVVAVGLWPATWHALRGHWESLRSLRHG
jgi:O-antigen/teichoic acid export membrane protein